MQALEQLKQWRRINTYLSFSSSVSPSERYELKRFFLEETTGKSNSSADTLRLRDGVDVATSNDTPTYDYAMPAGDVRRLRHDSMLTANELHDEHYAKFLTTPYFEAYKHAFNEAKAKHLTMVSSEQQQTDNADASTSDEETQTGAEQKINLSKVSEASTSGGFDPYEHCIVAEWKKSQEESSGKDKKKVFHFPKGQTSLTIGRSSNNDIRISDDGNKFNMV